MDIAGLDPSIDVVYQTLDLIGIFLCGIIGGTIARARNFDLVGMAFLAITTALGGGMIRDVLIDAGPPAALVNPWYFAMALAGSLLSALVRFDSRGWEVFRVHSDAVVLGVWAVTGSTKALANDLLWSSALFLGVITVVGGGMIRDMMTGSVPAVFGGTTLYATPAVFTAGLMVGTYALHDSGALPDFPVLATGMILSSVVGSGVVILAYWRGWKLPGTQVVALSSLPGVRQPIGLARAMRRRRRRMRAERMERRELRRSGRTPPGTEVTDD